jgi:hypothetical protein
MLSKQLGPSPITNKITKNLKTFFELITPIEAVKTAGSTTEKESILNFVKKGNNGRKKNNWNNWWRSYWN